MAKIQDKNAYNAAIARIEELLPLVDDNTPQDRQELGGASPSRISNYFSGRCEPTLNVARKMNQQLGIDANIILGV